MYLGMNDGEYVGRLQVDNEVVEFSPKRWVRNVVRLNRFQNRHYEAVSQGYGERDSLTRTSFKVLVEGKQLDDDEVLTLRNVIMEKIAPAERKAQFYERKAAKLRKEVHLNLSGISRLVDEDRTIEWTDDDGTRWYISVGRPITATGRRAYLPYVLVRKFEKGGYRPKDWVYVQSTK